MDDAQQEVLTSLTAQMFAEPIATGEVIVADPEPPAPAVAAPSAAMAPATPATPEAPQAPAPAPAAVAPVADVPAEPATTENVPTFKPKLTDDLQALLDEPDFEEEAELEVRDEVESGDYEYTDPETAAKLKALEKRNQFLETQLVAKSRKGWVEEAKRAYPDLARLLPGEIEGIDATSRRGFIRAADRLNTRYQTVLAPTLAKLEADRAAIASAATDVARAEVQKAWGLPAADTLQPKDAATAEALAKAREKAQATGDISDSIKVLMNNNPVL